MHPVPTQWWGPVSLHNNEGKIRMLVFILHISLNLTTASGLTTSIGVQWCEAWRQRVWQKMFTLSLIRDYGEFLALDPDRCDDATLARTKCLHRSWEEISSFRVFTDLGADLQTRERWPYLTARNLQWLRRCASLPQLGQALSRRVGLVCPGFGGRVGCGVDSQGA